MGSGAFTEGEQYKGAPGWRERKSRHLQAKDYLVPKAALIFRSVVY